MICILSYEVVQHNISLFLLIGHILEPTVAPPFKLFAHPCPRLPLSFFRTNSITRQHVQSEKTSFK